MNAREKIQVSFSMVAGSVSLIDFKTILDIILIVLSILNVLLILFFKLKDYLKDGKLDKAEKEDLKQDVNTLKKLIKKGEENGRQGK